MAALSAFLTAADEHGVLASNRFGQQYTSYVGGIRPWRQVRTAML